MYVKTIQLVFVVVFVLNLVNNGSCTKCYKCTTYDGTWQCGEPFDNTNIGTIECPEYVPCLKVKHPTVGGGPEPISRGCYDPNLCDEYSVCRQCNSELCNSSTGLSPSLTVTLVAGLIYFRRYLI